LVFLFTIIYLLKASHLSVTFDASMGYWFGNSDCFICACFEQRSYKVTYCFEIICYFATLEKWRSTGPTYLPATIKSCVIQTQPRLDVSWFALLN